MSLEAVPRVGQVGTLFTVTVMKPIPNTNPVEYEIVDLTNENGNCMIECMRPDKSRFKIGPATAIIPKTQGILQYTDDTGILNQAGLWRFRGIPAFTGSPNPVLPGSWQEQRVGV